MHYLFVDKGSLHKIIALKMIFAVLLVSFPVSCGSGNDPNFSFTSIEQGTDSAISLPNDAQVFKITSQSEWDDFWSRHKANITPMPQQPSVDFAQYMVIAVIDNVHSSGGYVMEITQGTAEPSRGIRNEDRTRQRLRYRCSSHLPVSYRKPAAKRSHTGIIHLNCNSPLFSLTQTISLSRDLHPAESASARKYSRHHISIRHEFVKF